MKRPAKILIWIVGILLGLALGAAIVVKAVFTKERILAMVTPRLEEAVNRPVSIGDAGISIWGGIGVWLGDVTVDNKPGFSDEAFLTIHRLELKARFWPLLAGNVELDRVILDAPSLLLEYDANDESNLAGLRDESEVALADSAATQAELPDEAVLAAPVTVDHFIMNGAQLVIRHEVPMREININGLFMDIITDGSPGNKSMRFDANVAVDSVIIIGEERDLAFREGRPEAFLRGSLNASEKLIQFDSIGLNWMGALIALQGRVQMHSSMTEIQVHADITPTSLTAISEQAYLSGFTDVQYDIDGELRGELEGSLNWPLPEGTAPDWSARLYLRDLLWRSNIGGVEFNVPTAEIRGERRVVSWSLSQGSFPSGTFSTNGTIDKVFTDNREFSARVTLDASMDEVMALMDTVGTQSITGRVKTDLSLFGSESSWKSMRITGPFRTYDLSVVDPSWSVDTITATVDWELTGQDITLRRTDISAGHSSVSVSGRVLGMIPAALASFEPPHVPRANLEIQSLYLNLDELMAEKDIEPDTSVSADSVSQPVVEVDTIPFVLPTLSATGTFECDSLLFDEVTYSALLAPFTFRDNVLTLDPAKCRVMGGVAEGACRWDLNVWDKPSFAVRVEADSIQTNDFLSKYLGWAGGLFGRVRFMGEFTGVGREAADILPTLRANGRALLSDGRLESAPLLARVGNRLGINELGQPHDIRHLLLDYYIEDGRLYTDTLGLLTDNARWIANGSYGFDETLNYDIRVNLTEAGEQAWGKSLSSSNLKLGLTGSLKSPVINIDVADAGKEVLKGLIDKELSDSTKTGIEEKARDLLKGLFKKGGDGG